jgi:hypothetical protein
MRCGGADARGASAVPWAARVVQLTTAKLCAKYVSALPDRGGGLGTNLPFFHEFAGALKP